MKKKSNKKNDVQTKNLNFYNLFWLFIVFSLIGVVGEGLWTLIFSGHWETHVVSMWTPLCIIYGLGAVGYYIADYFLKKQNIFVKFLVCFFVGTLVELACGLVLEFTIKMRAWSYVNDFLNYRGHICLVMSLLWGALGILFSYLFVPVIDKVFAHLHGKFYKIVTIICTIIVTIDFCLTFVCINRWYKRHYNIPPQTDFGKFIDKTYDDEYMQQRFIEWHFMD